MPAPTTDQARTRIIALLNDTSAVAAELKDALVVERQALEQQDIDAIDAVVERKSQCIEKLARMDKARENLCEKCGFAAGPNRMQELMAWCDRDDLIEQHWNHLLSIATESSTLNITNGAIIRVRQQQFECSLAVLRGTTPGSETYSPTGTESSDFGRHSIAQA